MCWSTFGMTVKMDKIELHKLMVMGNSYQTYICNKTTELE